MKKKIINLPTLYIVDNGILILNTVSTWKYPNVLQWTAFNFFCSQGCVKKDVIK